MFAGLQFFVAHLTRKVTCTTLLALCPPLFVCLGSVPAVLTITDIAGLVAGASEGLGLGNAFLSHIQV